MSTKRVLFTGARAPIVAYMAYVLDKAGCEVFAADSTYASVCTVSKFIRKFIKLPLVKEPAYKDVLCKAVRDYKIDYLIPTCEEIFYIAGFKEELSEYTNVFCDSAEKLISLHDKWAFYNYLSKAALKAPHTVLAEQADKNFEVAHIIKPRFSRFASKVKCTNILPDTMADKRHIVQDFVKGKQICSYALVQDGKIAAQCVYEPVLTAGKGAGILLKKIRHPQAEEISARISKDFSFSGQIAFDFIETAAKELYVIECNPRATNGLAFLGADFAQIIAGENKIKIYVPSALISRLAVWCYAILQPLKTIKARALSSRAADFISFKKDTLAWLAQLPVVFCWLLKGIRYGGPTAASTADIEFNGEDFL